MAAPANIISQYFTRVKNKEILENKNPRSSYDNTKLRSINNDISYYENNWPDLKTMARPVDETKKTVADATKHYIEMKSGAIKVRLDVNELSVDISHKSKFTQAEIDKLKTDLAQALDVVSMAAKLDEKLRPSAGVEI